MDYSRITEDMILERYQTLPDEIQEVLNSEEENRIVQAIGKTQYLDQPKMETFQLLVGYTLLGFIHTRELAHEISEALFLNFDHSRALVDELEKRLFAPVQKLMEQTYSPLPAEEKQRPSPRSVSGPTVSLNVFPSSKETAQIRPVPVKSEWSPSDNSDIKPFILHEERDVIEKSPASAEKKGFSLPFQFFRSTVAPTQTEKNPTRVEVELPSTRRVVHYSENASPTTPITSPVGAPPVTTQISPMKNPKVDPNLKPSPRSLPGFSKPQQSSPVDFSSLSPKEKEKPTPRIQGNMVDLR